MRDSGKFIFYGVLLLIFAAGVFSIAKNHGAATAMRQVAERKHIRIEIDDHYRGHLDAPVKLVEYGEGECPYCKDLQWTLEKILKERSGEVVWIYRHFPLFIHPKSFIEALALECATEQGGEEVFWRFLDELFLQSPSNDKIDLAILPEIAAKNGLSTDQFNECLAEARHNERVLRDIETGVALGVTKIPHLIVVAPNGKEFKLVGAPSARLINATIDIALTQNAKK